MKKILACMSLVFVLSAGATALAAENVIDSGAYTKEGNTLDVALAGATHKNTILITKNGVSGSDGIVFADQNDDTFVGVTTGFLLKGESLDPGTYTVKMNNAQGNGYEENEDRYLSGVVRHDAGRYGACRPAECSGDGGQRFEHQYTECSEENGTDLLGSGGECCQCRGGNPPGLYLRADRC